MESRSNAVAKLNFSHEAIARWMLENPGGKMGDCARHFNYSQAWLSQVIHSNAFQEYYRGLQNGANAVVLLDIPTKLRAIASTALDGLGEAVEQAMESNAPLLHREFLKETAETALKALGYGGGKTVINAGSGAVVNTLSVDAPLLARARERMQNAHSTPVERVLNATPAPGLPSDQ
jgi:hypothetical protein